MKKLLLLIDTMFYYDREVLKGIKAKLDELSLDVTIYIESIDNVKDILLSKWDYVIADYDKADKFRVLSRLDSQILLYSSHKILSPPQNVSTLVNDNEQFAGLALGQFMQNDLSQVGFYHELREENMGWAIERKECFMKQAKQFELNYSDPLEALKSKSFPFGVYCASDRSARKFANLCMEMNVSVPDQVAIIGTDYDDAERAISPVPLSSINIDPYQLGHRCVEVLLKAVRFKQCVHEKYQPITLVNEQSSQASPLQDDIVNRALYFLHNNYHLNVKVQQVLDYCQVSRKTLDSRFLEAKNMTVHQYLAELRLNKSKQLLKQSTESIENIALQCGYPNQSYLYQVFRKHCGFTPLEYRKGLLPTT